MPPPGDVAVRLLERGLLVVAGFLAGAAGWWALSVVLPPAAAVDEEPPPPTVLVQQGTVGRSVTLVAEAERERRALPGTMAAGRLTDLPAGPRLLAAGDTAFRVDDRPVVVAAGTVPSYRELAAGATGTDVEQLQRLLRDLGYEIEPDSLFGATTRTAVRQWQRDLGLEPTGRVAPADILFVAEVPLTVVPASGRALGDLVQPGDLVMDAVAAEPTFSVRVSRQQADLVPLDAEMVVDPGGAAWPARVVERVSGVGAAEEAIDLVIAAPGELCPPPCAEVGTEGRTVFPVDVVVVPETSGALVPISALRTTGGQTVVVLDSGEETPVVVLAAAHGQAVVEGVEAGDRVRVFGEERVDP